jgi:putative aminopeptidase FrvX
MPLPPINTNYLTQFLIDLLNIPSPTGYTENAIGFVEKELSAYPQLKLNHTRKGALVAIWEGMANDAPRALTAHVDTLGAMVKKIKSNGRLQITQIGGLMLNGVETEGCWVHTGGGQKIRGSYLINKASSHVFGKETWETQRNPENMEIRLDARVSDADEVRDLGIRVGNFVSFDTRTEVTHGFIRSRFLDDKACVAAIVAAIKSLADSGRTPAQVRTSGAILSILPMALALILWFLNPEYLMSFMDGPWPWCGWAAIGLIVVMISSGYFIMMKIADIEV